MATMAMKKNKAWNEAKECLGGRVAIFERASQEGLRR